MKEQKRPLDNTGILSARKDYSKEYSSSSFKGNEEVYFQWANLDKKKKIIKDKEAGNTCSFAGPSARV